MEVAATLERKAAPSEELIPLQEPAPGFLGMQGSSHHLSWKHQSCALSARSLASQAGTIPSATPETSNNSSYESQGLELAVDQGYGKGSQSWHS